MKEKVLKKRTKAKKIKNRPSIYLDYASITPISEKVLGAVAPFMDEKKGNFVANPSSNHELGVKARNLLQDSRKKIAEILSVKDDEIVFTSGATEANNLLIYGIISKAKESINIPRVITSSVEHSSILEPLKNLKQAGSIDLIMIDPSDKYLLDPSLVEKFLNKETVLIIFSHVNSETGDIVSSREIKRVVQKWKDKNDIENYYPYIHVDATQSATLLDESPHNIGADVVVFDGAKMYSLRGTGFMYVSRKVMMLPIFWGGGQERGIRPGTENVIAIRALQISIQEIAMNREKEYERIQNIKNLFIQELERNKIEFNLNFANSKSQNVIPSIANICIKRLDSEFAVVSLSSRGVHASAASACESSHGQGVSKVISRLLSKEKCASSSIRFSFGRYTTIKDVKIAVKILKEVIQSIVR